MSTFASEIWTNGLDKTANGSSATTLPKNGKGESKKGYAASIHSMRDSTNNGQNILYKILDGSNTFFGRSKRYSSDSEYASDSDVSSDDSALAATASKINTNSLPRLATSTSSLFRSSQSQRRTSAADSESEAESEAEHGNARKLTFKGLLKRSPSKPAVSTQSEAEVESSAIFKNILKQQPQPGQQQQRRSAVEPPLPSTPPSPATLSPQRENLSLDRIGRAPSLASSGRSGSESSLSEKYGVTSSKIAGSGATAVVRLCSPVNSDKKYAIKEFKPRRKGEEQKAYIKKLTAEFCISSSLVHENVVRTIDLIQDERKKWCLVMEYSEGGDLFAKIQAGLVNDPEMIDCYFKQLVKGVAYLHSEGVAHRDLKPENLLLDGTGRILRITDFGVSAVFHLPLETGISKCVGEVGSGPYMAPEVFGSRPYDPEFVDVWACGIIYYVMTYQSIPWLEPRMSDMRYKKYSESFGNFGPIERFSPLKRQLVYRMMNPDVAKRFTMQKVVESEWVQKIQACQAGMPAEASHHSHKNVVEKK
ncbi:serine/threonine-protein kinase HAL4/sat4 [Rhizoclosmatium hyalinum]|nr:serine/threonine-protein kinase HAL4/sat4 [Rhizoclosmatium hyalinum]